MIDQPAARERRTMLAAAFLGWLCAGLVMGLGPLIGRPALRSLLTGTPSEQSIGVWFAWYLCAFLLGGAVGGLLFGRVGDALGRVRAMGWSILCFSALTGATWFVRTPEQFLALRFLASLGVGGMWPAGVALVSEAWPEASRPLVAGAMGTAANVGILLMALIGRQLHLTPESWRPLLLAGAVPAVLGLWVLMGVPESPRWLAQRKSAAAGFEVFRPPLLKRTLLGILLGTIPLLGTWSSGKWLIPWADSRHANAAGTQAVWAVGAVLGSAAGGWVANQLGRRTTYFIISLASWLINVAIYRWLEPGQPAFLAAVFVLGLVATVFFGWLPLYLPELFPTRVRATGAGVTYNFGRFASAAGVLAAGSLMTYFEGDYARVGEVTAWVYALGAAAIFFAPDTGKDALRD